MQKVFIDANLLIDYLSLKADADDRKCAMAIIYHCYKYFDKAFISTHSLMVLFHITDKQFVSKTVLKHKLKEVYELFNVVPINNQDIQFAFDSNMADFEDAVQLSCALKADADFIVTKNMADFYDTELSVIPPDQFFDFI